MASRNFTQKMFTLQNYPVLLNLSFTVAATNASGITGLVGSGIQNVFMHTSTTPTIGSPNPQLGTAIIFLQDNYNKFLGLFDSIASPASGVALTSGLTVGKAYSIGALSSTTLAQWQTAGLPKGVTPAVGVAFIAAATSVAGGGSVQAPIPSLVSSIEVVGNPTLTLKNSYSPIAGTAPYIIVRFKAPQAFSFSAATNTSTTVNAIAAADVQRLQVGMLISGTGIPVGTTIATIASTTSITISQAATASATITAVADPVNSTVQPADGSKIFLGLYLSNSSLPSQGE